MAVVSTNPTSNFDAVYGISTSTPAIRALAQSFTSDGSLLTNAQFYLSKDGSPAGTAVARLYAHTGTFGASSGLPTGPVLAEGSVDQSLITGSSTLIDFTFDVPYQSANGTNYFISFEPNAGSSGNDIYVGVSFAASDHPGRHARRNSSGVWSSPEAEDLIFVIEGTLPSPSLSPSSSLSSSTSPSSSVSPSASVSPSSSESSTPGISPSSSASASLSPSSSVSASLSPSSSASRSQSPSSSVSLSRSPSSSASLSYSPSSSASGSLSPSASVSLSASPSSSVSVSESPSSSISPSVSPSPSQAFEYPSNNVIAIKQTDSIQVVKSTAIDITVID